MIHFKSRTKFKNNTHNKSDASPLFSIPEISDHCGAVNNDTDTLIVRVALIDATDDSVEVSTVFLLIQRCMAVDFTGAGKRCRFADAAGAILLKYQPLGLGNIENSNSDYYKRHCVNCHEIALKYNKQSKTSLYMCTIRNCNGFGMKNFSIRGF